MTTMATMTKEIQEPSLTTTLVGSTSGPGFLDLPTEVRLEIYQYLFQSSKLSCQTPHTTAPACGYKICICLFPHQITKTSRQLRYEALPMLLGATTVQVLGSFSNVLEMPRFYLESLNTAVVWDAKMFSVRPFQMHHLPNLKVLELRNITVWCKFYDEVFLESAVADEVMYSMALFNVQRTGRKLLQLCEASRTFAVRLCCQFVVNSMSDETIHAVVDIDTKKIVHKSRGPPMRSTNAWSGFY